MVLKSSGVILSKSGGEMGNDGVHYDSENGKIGHILP
jgi:hypothetical protein